MQYQVYYNISIIPLRRHLIDADVEFRPGQTHAFIRTIEAENKDAAYRQMQGCIWSPNGEARDLIRAAGVSHTSMSVGDVLIDQQNRAWLCIPSGWREIPTTTPDK